MPNKKIFGTKDTLAHRILLFQKQLQLAFMFTCYYLDPLKPDQMIGAFLTVLNVTFFFRQIWACG